MPVNIWMIFLFLSGFSFTQHSWFIGQQRKRESNSSVIKRKGEPQIRCYKKRKHAIFFRKTNMRAHARVRIKGKKCSLFEKFGVLCFLLTPVLRFALLPYYRRILTLLHHFHPRHKHLDISLVLLLLTLNIFYIFF